jgi:hypothetical protein
MKQAHGLLMLKHFLIVTDAADTQAEVFVICKLLKSSLMFAGKAGGFVSLAQNIK